MDPKSDQIMERFHQLKSNLINKIHRRPASEEVPPQDLLILQPEKVPKTEKVSNPTQERRISSRIQARPQPTEFYGDWDTQYEPNIVIESFFEESKETLNTFSNIDDYYCRLCFRIFTISDPRTELDDDFRAMFRDLMHIAFKLSHGSQWICSNCQCTIDSFRKFKEDIMNKQAKFGLMVAKNDHQKIEKIQELGGNKIQIKTEPEDYPMVSQPMVFVNESIEKPLKLSRKNKASPKRAPAKKNLRNRHGKQQPKNQRRERSQICPHCAKRFAHLDYHISNIHHGERNFFCDLCPYSCYSKYSIRNHIRGRHLPKDVQCLCCSFKTYSKRIMENHIRNRHEIKLVKRDFVCSVPECRKQFVRREDLMKHVKRAHEIEWSIKCEYPDCLRLFHTKSELQQHIANFHAPKNFICDQCGKKYSSAKMLRRHFEVHAEYAFPCTIEGCVRKFRSQVKLNRHIKIEHAETPEYKCQECPAEYFRKIQLRRHIFTKHLGITFDCQVHGCVSKFTRRDALIFHLRRQHPELTNDDLQMYKKKLDDFCVSLKYTRRNKPCGI